MAGIGRLMLEQGDLCRRRSRSVGDLPAVDFDALQAELDTIPVRQPPVRSVREFQFTFHQYDKDQFEGKPGRKKAAVRTRFRYDRVLYLCSPPVTIVWTGSNKVVWELLIYHVRVVVAGIMITTNEHCI